MAQKRTTAAKKSTGKTASAAKKNTTSKKTSGKRSTTGRSSARKTSSKAKGSQKDLEIIPNDRSPGRNEGGFRLGQEIAILLVAAFSVILILGSFGITGAFGEAVNGVLFGLFGAAAYVFPFAFFFITVYLMVNNRNHASVMKSLAIFVLFLTVSMLFQFFWSADFETKSSSYAGDAFWNYAVESKHGGGFIGGHLCSGLTALTGPVGAVIIMITAALICFLMLTGKSILRLISEGSREAAESVKETAYDAYEELEQRRERRRRGRDGRVIPGRRQVDENWHYMENTRLEPEQPEDSDDMHELTVEEDPGLKRLEQEILRAEEAREPERDHGPEELLTVRRPVREIRHEKPEPVEAAEIQHVFPDEPEELFPEEEPAYREPAPEPVFTEPGFTEPAFTEPAPEPVFRQPEPVHTEPSVREPVRMETEPRGEEIPSRPAKRSVASSTIPEGIRINESEPDAEYMLPDTGLLKQGNPRKNSSAREQKETAEKLKNTLASFGVNVTITDVSQGPTVTRYEMLPEAGVKVSRILGLTDDIKLALAAENIRIEAPIPGKSAVGIEVPNKDVQPVMLRELLESEEFVRSPSRVAFAVGKDIGGKTVVFDIAKMPHVLIAGATGSGKSVCINTIIMSILYKAKPEEVKLIMIDPKVVELSIYNGIPHLMMPVVTDPQKAAGALQWGVAEMDKRYNSFAEHRVRKIEEYNQKAEREGLTKMPLLVIIVDELADLMMTAKGDVENAIVRLAQKARAAGIHLIIATQRPSVDVITGLIKANMPSRVAFAVTSGTDSRTILDMVGAEKLLGKGDMLFYPMGYSKPARVQGAFVSDEEVSDVATFIRSQKKEGEDAEDISSQIETMMANSSTATSATSGGAGAPGDDGDELFMQAAEFAVNLDKETISIGLLQRKFRLGFNRAARIMDQLHDEGVVGEDSGTKGRSIIMTPEQFEQFKEERA